MLSIFENNAAAAITSPSSLLSFPAPSRFMTLAYSFAASLAGEEERADGRTDGRTTEERRPWPIRTPILVYYCSRSPSLPFPLLSSGHIGRESERRGRPHQQRGWGRHTRERRRDAEGCRSPPLQSLAFSPLSLSFPGPFQVLTFHSRVRPSAPPSFWLSCGLSLLVPPTSPCLPLLLTTSLLRSPLSLALLRVSLK